MLCLSQLLAQWLLEAWRDFPEEAEINEVCWLVLQEVHPAFNELITLQSYCWLCFSNTLWNLLNLEAEQLWHLRFISDYSLSLCKQWLFSQLTLHQRNSEHFMNTQNSWKNISIINKIHSYVWTLYAVFSSQNVFQYKNTLTASFSVALYRVYDQSNRV